MRNLVTYILVFGLGVATIFFYFHHTANTGGHGSDHDGRRHSQAMSSAGPFKHGSGMHKHDEINMPGCRAETQQNEK